MWINIWRHGGVRSAEFHNSEWKAIKEIADELDGQGYGRQYVETIRVVREADGATASILDYEKDALDEVMRRREERRGSRKAAIDYAHDPGLVGP